MSSAYAPKKFKAGFYDLLTKTLLDLTDFRLFLSADFNAVWDSNIDRTGGVESRDQCLASDVLCQWAAHTGMIDIWRVMNPSIKDYSFLRHKSFSGVHFFFASKDLFQNV